MKTLIIALVLSAASLAQSAEPKPSELTITKIKLVFAEYKNAQTVWQQAQRDANASLQALQVAAFQEAKLDPEKNVLNYDTFVFEKKKEAPKEAAAPAKPAPVTAKK
jgi:hypothetical protein